MNKKILKSVLALTLTASMLSPLNVLADKEHRIAGQSRFDTAIELAKLTKSDTAVVMNYQKFPDAITATKVANANSPIYFTAKDRMDSKTLYTILNNHKKVVIVGGKNAVSKTVENQLLSLNVERVEGNDRYETNAKGLTNTEKLIIVSGEQFADALVTSSISKKLCSDVALTQKDNVPNGLKNYLKNNKNLKEIFIVGGKASVSPKVEKELKAYTKANINRISGYDRYETSERLADIIKNSKYTIVNGEQFADNLLASPFSQRENRSIILTKRAKHSKYVMNVFENKDYVVVGGKTQVEIPTFAKPEENKPSDGDTTKPSEQKPEEKPVDPKPEDKPADKPEDKKPEEKPTEPEKPSEKPEEKPVEDKLLDVDSPELSAKEKELIKLVNDYREQHGKKRLKVSKSLMKVARTHVNDLNMNFDMANPPVDSRGIKGNMHSWSDKGNWTPVVYTKDHKHDKLTKIKPKEIAGYDQTGYEVAVNGFLITPQRALEKWKNSPGHNDTILSQNGWDPTPEEIDRSFTPLSNMGVAINGDYACIWFTRDDYGIVDPMGYFEFN
ncbi:cell wall-binding repeat-containing protein [Finegoldia magna]|uniref:Putative N-acetylmuramoyl-L-alanine amidase n=1 Tax=Finegoldia magna (strain ATCC 29328 / DSM 20472 / WAL 2508) TaxID=334413 RepID=B0S4A4_FINM2|nr:cell wall-binding repeat-containing protein [Finegoldia magna]UEA71225.1 cell wall-binding repeat-containing protein [Finegoldia magna]BAG09095.1 putative N-acetylmuramoyl-L-alanine amidase [Finegoldia magna ATCC 29328]